LAPRTLTGYQQDEMSEGTRQLPPKKEVALALLEGPSMFVHLDPRRAGVVVPKRFLDKPQLVLQIGLNMFIPIPDLKVDDEGITCTLSFDRAPFWCRMPWSAIYALVGEDGRGMMWPNDIPPEVVAQMQNPPQQQAAAKPAAKKPRPRLAAVGDGPPSEGAVSGPVSKGVEPPSSERGEESSPEPSEPPAQAEIAAAVASGERETADAEDTERKDDDGATARPQAGGRKPKRELPPYLRVIK
jgi:stringent starvation protein B